MQSQGWTLRSREEIKVGETPALLIHFEQPLAGQHFVKWALLLGTERNTSFVVATCPSTQEKTLSAMLKAAVLSTRLDDAPKPEPGSDMPFTLTASSKLKLAPGINKMLGYTKDGMLGKKAPGDPLFIAAASIGPTAIGHKRLYALRRLLQTSSMKGIRETSTEPIAIDGLEGFEMLAEAEDAASGTPMSLYQVMLFEGESYILMQGLVGSEQMNEYLPEFKKMAHSLKRKTP
jgi:hypothetical protein